jgi:hypothetical protein
MVERDRKNALLQIQNARIAIQERAHQLRHEPPRNQRETQDLVNALTYLAILLTHNGD